jgi:CBS domain-containing protein
MLQLKDLMSVPVSIELDSTLEDVVKIIQEKKISRVLVTEHQTITSIVTQKDICAFLLNDKSNRSLKQIPTTELVKPLKTISISSEISECAKLFLQNDIGSLGILSNKNIVGIVTKTDVVRYFLKHHTKEKSVGEFMSAHYSWVYWDSLLSDVVKKMVNEKISRIIVRNKEDVPIGIMTFRDVYNLVISMGSQRGVTYTQSFDSDHGLGKTLRVDEAMQNEIITTNYHDDLIKACQLILDNKINGLGVLSKKGDLVGILSKTDVVKAITTLN